MMITANARYESATAKLESQVRKVTSGIEKEYKVTRRNEQNAAQQLATVKKNFAGLNRKEFKLKELERDVETNRRLYDLFFNRVRETSETVGFQSAHARVVQTAVPPIKPVEPKKSMIVGLAFIMSLFAGVLLAFLRDMLDNTLKSPDDVAERLHAPLLGILPDMPVDKNYKGPFKGYLEDNTSTFAESIRTIRTGLMLSGLDNPHQITVVTSSVPGEGKSTVSVNLSAALAQMSKVLLIDADLRRPSIAKTFDLPTNPLEMLSSTKFKTLVTSLAEKYDRIIIDSAPVTAVSDSLILATLADSLIYVVKADATPATLIVKAITQLQRSNIHLTGVVLNKLDMKRQSAYGGDGYYGAYYSYGESS